jgi:hypothetical protein
MGNCFVKSGEVEQRFGTYLFILFFSTPESSQVNYIAEALFDDDEADQCRQPSTRRDPPAPRIEKPSEQQQQQQQQ